NLFAQEVELAGQVMKDNILLKTNSKNPLYNSEVTQYNNWNILPQEKQMENNDEFLRDSMKFDLDALGNDVTRMQLETQPFGEQTYSFSPKSVSDFKEDFSSIDNALDAPSHVVPDFDDSMSVLDGLDSIGCDIPTQIDNTFDKDPIPVGIETEILVVETEKITDTVFEVNIPSSNKDDNDSVIDNYTTYENVLRDDLTDARLEQKNDTTICDSSDEQNNTSNDFLDNTISAIKESPVYQDFEAGKQSDVLVSNTGSPIIIDEAMEKTAEILLHSPVVDVGNYLSNQDSDQRLQNQHLQEKTTAQEKIEVEIPSGMSNATNTIPVEKITIEIPLQDMRKVTDTQHLSETEEKITAQEKIEVEIPSGMSNATTTIPVEKITTEIPLQDRGKVTDTQHLSGAEEKITAQEKIEVEIPSGM
ncbi:MAG: hypothetical protein ACRC5H_07395, partial [Treponemataceae bacterium]